MRERFRAGGERGFTLLEMLVVVVVLGLLVVALDQGVRAALGIWNAQQHRLAETAELDTAEPILRRLLAGISVAPGGPGAVSGGFQGAPDHLNFVGELPTGLGATRRADIAIAVHAGNLVLTWTPHRHEIPLGAAPAPAEVELVAHVKQLVIAYWGATTPDRPAGWQAQWDGPVPPQLIRIRLVFPDGDRRRWPDLIAAPLL